MRLRPNQTYSCLTDDSDENEKGKGTKKFVIKKTLNLKIIIIVQKQLNLKIVKPTRRK